MAHCLICYPNWIDLATLSGGNWQLPLTNLQTRFQAEVTRSTDLQESSCVINGAFDRFRYTTAIALTNHNLSLSATIRMILYGDVAQTKILYDSGVLPVWPRYYHTLQLRWHDSNFWGGKIREEDRKKIKRPLFVHIPSSQGFASSTKAAVGFKIQINDALNTDGYVQFGRLFFSEDWTPKFNMIYGASIQWVDNSTVDRAMDGTKWFNKKTPYRQVVFQLKYMKPAEGVNKALQLTQQVGVTGEVLYIFDPSDAMLLQQRSFVGNLSELSPCEWWMFGLTSMSFKIEEAV